MGLDTLDVPQFDNQFIKSQITLFLEPTLDPACHTVSAGQAPLISRISDA